LANNERKRGGKTLHGGKVKSKGKRGREPSYGESIIMGGEETF